MSSKVLAEIMATAETLPYIEETALDHRMRASNLAVDGRLPRSLRETKPFLRSTASERL
jgi:hypothetical protein